MLLLTWVSLAPTGRRGLRTPSRAKFHRVVQLNRGVRRDIKKGKRINRFPFHHTLKLLINFMEQSSTGIAKRSAWNKGMKMPPRPLEVRQAISQKMTGIVRSPETRKRMSVAQKGLKLGQRNNKGTEFKSGEQPWNKGLKDWMSSESKQLVTTKMLGVRNSPSTEFKPGKWSHEQRLASKSWRRRGQANNMWKGGVTALHTKERKTPEYKIWREKVFARDNWTCQECKTRGGTMNAHHIEHFAVSVEKRLLIENGITLCRICHTNLHRKHV